MNTPVASTLSSGPKWLEGEPDGAADSLKPKSIPELEACQVADGHNDLLTAAC